MAAYEYAHHVRLMPYAYEYILRLKASHMKLAAATGLPEELYKPCLIHNGVYEWFDFLCSVDQVQRGKEYPDIFLFATDRLRTSPQKCIVFEDVLPAVTSAKQAGMITYGVYDKYSSCNEAEIRAIADGYIYDFRNAPLSAKGGMMMPELWDLYNEMRQKTGILHERGKPISQGLYHLVVSAWIVNSRGKYLMSQRHPSKPHPKCWECTGGSVLAGESSAQGVVREVKEELSLTLDVNTARLIYQTRRDASQDFYDVWLFHSDTPAAALTLQSDEVIDAQWLSKEAIYDLQKNGELHPLIDYLNLVFSDHEKCR